MQRCIQLARQGEGRVSPNPMVGAVLVYQDRIIGEGWHRAYGQAHAEVNCIDSVAAGDLQLLSSATLYVSLEPCAHFGKTPPCADLIIRTGIPKVVIGCRDPFEAVNGKGIEKLRAAGVEVTVGVLEKECMALNKRFFTFHQLQRPYVILKWAQTADGFIAASDQQHAEERLRISNDRTDRLVHRWRASEDTILVGRVTAALDNPSLTNRHWPGAKNPVRLVLDPMLTLPHTLQVFNGLQQTVVFNYLQTAVADNYAYIQVERRQTIASLLHACYEKQWQSVLVEGGRQLLQSFINESLWDEARVITNTSLQAGAGVSAPVLQHAAIQSTEHILADRIAYFKRSPL